jgi:tRNA threonylcarbamoyladenosine biosynthesis protein TsaB
MKVLALDTTTRAGSVAIVDDDRVVDERGGDGSRPHAERLPDEIIAIAAANRLALSEIDLYGVASGPGSFTGLRIGIATIQGLAFVHRRRVVAIPALEALAQIASLDMTPGTLVASWMDAHRHDVFSAVYRVAAAAPFTPARLTALEEPAVGDPASTLARWVARFGTIPAVFVGDGAVMHAPHILGADPAARVVAPPLIAGALGRLAIARHADAIEPSAVRPLYVRRPDAEVLRDEKRRAASAAAGTGDGRS